LAGVTFGDGAVWVATEGFAATVLRIDPGTYAVEATVAAGGSDFTHSIGMVVGEGYTWVTNATVGQVFRIALAGNDVQQPIDVGKAITGIAVGLGAVWVTVDEP
jgi:DNA-binding beta-propeller fold protein YncE